VCSKNKKVLASSYTPLSSLSLLGFLAEYREVNRNDSQQIPWQSFSSVFPALPPPPGIAVAPDRLAVSLDAQELEVRSEVVMSPDKQWDTHVTRAFNSNEIYFTMLDHWHRLHEGLAVEPLVKHLIQQACRPGVTILEAGCGSGNCSNWFAAQYPNVQFTGVDISRIGVQKAQAGAPPNAQFQVADLKKLPFPPNHFHFAFAQSVLEHVVGWEDALTELYRVVRPGGQLLIRVGNGGVIGVSLYQALWNYLWGRTCVTPQLPSFELTEGDWEAHRTQFDVQEIPSDLLLRTLCRTRFSIAHFTTGVEQWRYSKDLRCRVVSYFNFWPFSHLGSVSLVVAQK
jgi:SAM-dependent methyltransferase